MRILLDESLPRKLGFLPIGHHVRTVQQMGFSGLSNGTLLRAASNEFDVLISGDQNMSYQQNPVTLPISVVVMIAKTNKLEDFTPLVTDLLALLQRLPPQSFITLPQSSQH
jgi:Domain of unknown function (DUF5615)